MEVNSSEPSSPDTTKILNWYSRLHSRRVDLVGDFAGSERFLVHGESLLSHCFSDEHLDFSPGFQLLHAVYAVEKFLHGLLSRQCHFHIAFFDDDQDLCVPQDASLEDSEKYLLARAAIIRHLQVNLKDVPFDVEVYRFASTSSTSFTEYLQNTDIYFVLCHDGASLKDLQKRNILRKNLDTLQDENNSSSTRQETYKTSFRTLIYTFMKQGYSAALINGLEWRDTKIETTVLEHSRLMDIEVSALSSSAATDGSTIKPEHIRNAINAINSNAESPLTEREYLSILLATKLASSAPELSTALLYHTALLSEKSLDERHVPSRKLSSEAHDFVINVAKEARNIVSSSAWGEELGNAACDIGDMIDGRIFALCVEQPPTPTPSRFELLQETAEALSGRDFDIPDKVNSGEVSKSTNGDSTEASAYSLLPFSNDVFDEHLKPIHLKTSQAGSKADATSSSIFREVSHWHNNKRPIENKTKGPLDKDPKIVKKALRRNQFFMAEMTSYAASLTNAVGKVLEPEIITMGDKGSKAAPAKAEAKRPKQQARQSTKNVNAAKQAMLADIAASSKKKEDDNAKQLYNAWGVYCKGLETQTDLASRYNNARQYLVGLNSELKRKTLEPEVRLYMLNVLVQMWIRTCSDNATKEDGIYIAALIFDTVRSFCNLPSVPKSIATCLQTTVKRLRLPSLSIPTAQGDRKLPFQFILLDESATFPDLSIDDTPEHFQLLHCGPYFDRTMDAADDPRVPFQPDAWQRQVLDEIDARRSLLVIAPTSAGKTFISFYAMKQVLEASNDDVLVYVAPTKALVNQIAAEVQARFSKNYKYSQSVWGIHTRDYRINNPTGCQVLVTVPHILQIMLLAPSHAKSWSERVKWIIFDEVHCIGQSEEGLIWEQLLLMAPCPIIALSATIGNAEAFNDWLASTQKAAGHEFVMVQHPHRYSDLRKFVYNPPEKTTPSEYLPLPTQRTFAQLGLDEKSGNFAFLHPIASLINRARGIPSDFTLEARDCLSLWQSMKAHQTEKFPVDKSLDPSAILPPVIKKADIIKWQAALKPVLETWMADESSPFEAVRKDLSQSLVQVKKQPNSSVEADQDDQDSDEMELKHDMDSILPLLADLQRQDALPGIIFNYDRAVCENMAQTLMQQLADAEESYKQSSSKWKDKLRKWDDWKKEMARREKQGVRGANKGLTKEDQMREAASEEVSDFASFNPEDPLDGFHFANNKKMSKTEFDGLAYDMRRRGVDEWLINSLKRGIGVHHAGCNRKYRYTVEMLFRRGYLRVVIATGTLALGINMPCKTVVFSGDSVFLTALNFRQAAGRAGRRGFDNLGNVVFHQVSMSKIHKLISSRLPDLNGHFPITTTLVLRLFTLLHSSENSRFAVRSVNALLSQPRLYLGGEEAKMTVLHHLRFSIEYLRRQHLLDSKGAPLNLAGAVSHLYFTENSSFAFHALLKDGYFHNLCNNFATNQESVLRELMLTLSHLFGRRYFRQADRENEQEVIKKSPSIVFLPPMPEKAADILSKHNKAVLDIFSAYVRTFVDQHVKHPDNKLPLTGVTVGANSASAAGAKSIKARSSFVALSGHDDTFESIHDLCSTSRSGVFLEEAVIPHVGVEESGLPLNAYLYDYFNHSNPTALITANKIRRGDLWFALNDFSMVLATIVTSLSNFMNLGSDSDLDMIDVRGGGDEAEETREDKFLPLDTASEITNLSGTTLNSNNSAVKTELPIQVKKKKAKVVDSWEEASEEEEEDDVDEDWDAGDSDAEQPAWEEGAGLLNVLKAFRALKEDFDTKFRAMWA